MTNGFGAGAMPTQLSEAVLSNKEAQDCLLPMGITSENVSADYNISRETQDAFSAESFRKAAIAQKAGKFKEIIPVKVKWTDPKTEEEKEIVVDKDDGIRDDVTRESLGKLKPAFKKDGSTTAGSSSQVSDGAAAVLLARRSVAKKLGLPILAKFVVAQAVGVSPRIMGVGPAYAIPKALAKAGITVDDVDFWEVSLLTRCCLERDADSVTDQRGFRVSGHHVHPNAQNPFQQGEPLGRRYLPRPSSRRQYVPSLRPSLQTLILTHHSRIPSNRHRAQRR